MFLNELKTPKFWLVNILTTFLYSVTGLLSNMWAVPNNMVAPLWLPSGFALAMMLWWGPRVSFAILISELIVTALLGNIHSWQNWVVAIIAGAGAALQAYAGAWLIEKFTHTKIPFHTVSDVFIFVFGAGFLVSLINTTIGTTSLVLFGLLPPSEFFNNWYIWWIGDAVGVIVITPIVMIWYHAKININKKQLIEFVILTLLLGVTIGMIRLLHYPLTYILIPFCVWAAIRFGTELAVIVAFLVATSVLWLQIQGYKEFQVVSISKSLLFLQAYVAVIFFTTLVLSAVLTERKKAQQELIKSNLELEERVLQRTQDLAEKNVALNQVLTELKQAETQLIQAEKMSSLGVLTAGIAHEINNAVNFISANIQPLKNDIEDIMQVLDKYTEITPETSLSKKLTEIKKITDEINLTLTVSETRNLLAGMEEGAKRTAGIVKDLRTFSRLDESELKLVNIHNNIDSTLTLLHSQYRDRITIIKNYGDIPEIECYPGRLNQVFMNILTNAIHAIPDKGEITITTLRLDNKIVIRIKDSGSGMSKEIMAKIFEPFFTTKEVGKGTGLGLSISYSIIQDHHGTIEVNSKIGKGSEFIITIPIKYSA